MNLLRTRPLADWDTPQQAMGELCSGFVGSDRLKFDARVVVPDDIPQPFRTLLVHDKHMTLTLTAHYGAFMELRVREMHFEGDLYSRKIQLTIPRTHTIVEYGLIRLDLRYVSQQIWPEIFQQRTPMGELLLRHNILQRVQPRWYLKITPDTHLMRWLGADSREPLYGRLGTIYCNGEPAVEVMEVVTGV